jgi:hypothetical protein
MRSHRNDIRVTARQLPMTRVEKLLEEVFSVGSAPKLYGEDSRPAEFRSVKLCKGG